MRHSDGRVFVDTSWWKALIDQFDDFHLQSVEQWERIKQQKMILLTTNFVLDESYTLLRVRRELGTALDLRQTLFDIGDQLAMERVSIIDEGNAWDWFEEDWSKLSYTDCTSFAVMKRLGLTQAASFDQHFVRAGFALLT